MPNFTAEKPHAITCIKKSIQECLLRNCGDDITVVCDRDYCWRSDEIFRHRAAINLVATTDIIESPVKFPTNTRKLGENRAEKDLLCKYDARILFEIQIYVEDCDCDPDCEDCDCLTGKDKAYSILGHVTETLFCKQDEIAGRRILYRGSTSSKNSESEIEIAVVIANFEVHYLFDQSNPSWVA